MSDISNPKNINGKPLQILLQLFIFDDYKIKICNESLNKALFSLKRRKNVNM